MGGSALPKGSGAAGQVSLAEVLTDGLIGEVLDSLPRWQSAVGKMLRLEFERVLENAVLERNPTVVVAPRAKDLSAADLKNLLRPVLDRRDADAFFACCIWADTQDALKKQGSRALRTSERALWNTALGTKPNFVQWSREELEQTTRALSAVVPGVSEDRIRLFAFVMVTETPDSAEASKRFLAPIPAASGLTDPQLATLREVLRQVSAQVGIGPLRQAAKDGELYGKGSRLFDVEVFKRFVADADHLASHLAEAFATQAQRASAVRTLQRVALEACQTPALNPRARSAFQRAHKAFKAGDWEQLKRSGEILAKLRDEASHPLLELTDELLAFLSGDHERVMRALTPPPPTSAEPAAVSEPATPSEPVAVSEPATPSEPVTPSASTVSQPAPMPPASVNAQVHRERLEEYRSAFQALCAELRAAIAGGPTRERLGEASSRLSDALRSMDPSLLDSFGNAAELRAWGASQGARIAEHIQHLSEVAASLEQAAWQLASTVSGRLGSAAPIDGSLGGLPRLSQVLEAEVARYEQAAAELLERIKALPLDVPVEVLPPFDPAAGMQAGIEQLQRFEAAVTQALQARAAVPPPTHAEPSPEAAPPVPASAPASDGLAFQTAGPIPSLLSSGLLGRLREEARRETANEPVVFLPVDARAREPVLIDLPATASSSATANAAARNLLTLWAAVVKADSPMRPLAQCLEFLGEATKIRQAVRGDAAAPSFERIVAAMALHCATMDRLEARGRRRLAGLLASSSPQALDRGSVECAEAASHSPALARACAELVAHGLHAPLAEVISALSSSAPATARRLLEGVATAVALSGRDKSGPCRAALLQALGADPQDSEIIEDFLEDSERQSRRSLRPDVPKLKSSQPLVTDFVVAMGSRFWERGRGSASVPRIGVSIPKAAEEGLFLTPGARHIEVPILVRNGGELAAGGISLLLSRPAKGDSPITSSPVELHVPWLSDQNLEDTSSVIVSSRLELDPDKTEQLPELRLALRASWFGGAHDETFALPLRFEETTPITAEITGYSGEPVDLSDEKTFRVSSASVRDCFRRLRERLHQGKAVRAVIFGRRRRGKSSICSSIERDAAVQQQFSIRHHVWNGPRMTTVATAFATISQLLVSALARSGVDAPRLDVTDLSRAEDLSQRFLHWVDTLAGSLQQKKRVLILLDEFQKWIAGLGSKQERLALLSALRHFNDQSGKLEVSFVLSGLQSLKGLVQESTDLANAVEFFEMRELTQEEADRYLRERVPLELDGRTRRRLYSLSGGNPYVLNRLSGGLLELLRNQRRSWCTAADVDALLLEDEAQTGRLAEFVRYMLHEDEDDGASTLRQLTVLRAVASMLHERGDFDGYVRLTDVEAWLQRHDVEFEPGEPRQQLEELTRTGLVQSREGGRYFLRGEWLCRQLAALDPDKVKLQPVTSRSDPDLVLGRYRKKRPLGQGGEAWIWLAENVQEGGHDVVLRIYPRDTVGLHQRIERERTVLSRIVHPNVVGFHGASIDERHGGVVVLTYVQGDTLEHVLEAKPASALSLLPGGEIAAQVQFLKKIVSAVDACHVAGVVHKDLSPRNIMVAQRLGVWEPTLIDFGLSGLDAQPSQEETILLGTPGYIAPEKIRGGRRTPAADIYSLGGLFLRMLTGYDPREGVGTAGRVSRLCEEAKVPARLSSLLQQMLGEDPALRPSASEVRGCLETVLQPLSWRELREKATEAFIDNRWEDAILLFGQALSTVPGGERGGEPYEALLGEAADALERSSQPVPWDMQWLDKWILLARTAATAPRNSRELPSILARYRARFPQEGARLIHQLAIALAQPPSSPSMEPVVRAIARQELYREAECATATFEALARYYAEKLLDVGVIEDFCVACARHARVRLQQPLTAQLWLQRVRSLGQPTRGDYEQELQALLESRRKTGRLQALPEAKQQEPLKVGAGERAHLAIQRLEEFDRRVRRLFPFIYRLERIHKDGNIKVSRPTLLRQENIGRHLPQGSTGEPGNIIPFAVDGSFTAEGIPLRMNIVLPVGTTPSQLDAAINVLKEATDLFDFHG